MAAGRIRALTEDDSADWRRLFDGYVRFYEREPSDARAAAVWGWIRDPDMPFWGYLGIADDGRVAALAHFREMPSPMRGTAIGFLDDLFVEPAHRGGGLAEALLAAIADFGRQRGWPIYRWITREGNFRARGLYERVATRTDWITYEYAVD